MVEAQYKKFYLNPLHVELPDHYQIQVSTFDAIGLVKNPLSSLLSLHAGVLSRSFI